MERLVYRRRPASWWSQYFLVLITGLLISFFMAPTARAADDTYSIKDKKITIKSDIFVSGSYSDGAENPKIKCQSGTTNSTIKISQESKDAVADGKNPDSISYSIDNIDSSSNDNGCPSGSRTAQYSANSGEDDEDPSACNIDGFGWMICGPSTWIATGMDTIYGWLESFLETQPLEINNTDSMVFKAWGIMRTIANSVFIIVFIMIIYSQISSVGISNYGIKKLAPRLIAAALLVNLSYYICAIGVDLSNILGTAVKDMFDAIMNQLTNGAQADINTSEIITKTLGGGALIVGGVVLAKGTLLAAAPFILPVLLSLFLAGLVAILVLSVRQALIIILIIIAPLAFVANLLPGTEKLFGKWRDLFITMLVFHPAFALVFGGANMAGMIISSTAGGSVIRFILGWIVQLAPLAITPLIMKLGGGLIGKLTGIVNNPSKGLIDKAKQRAQKQSELIGNKRTFGNDNLSKRNFLRRRARANYRRNRLLDDQLATSQTQADNSYRGWDKYKEQDIANRNIEQDKEIVNKQLDHAWNKHVMTNSMAMEKDLKLRVTTDKSELSKLKLDNRYDEFKAGANPVNGPMTQSVSQLMTDAQDATQMLAVEGFRKANAQRSLNNQLAENMLANQELRKQAGGIYGDLGADSALASAINTMRSEYGKSVEEGRQISKHFNLSAEQRQAHAMGERVEVKDSRGNIRVFDHNNTYTREAAIEDQIATGTVNDVKQIVEASGSSLAEFKTTISDSIAKSGVKGKAPFMGGKLINEIAKGTIQSEVDLTQYAQEWIAEGKFKPDDVSITDPQGLSILMKAARTAPITKRKDGESSTDFASRQANFNTKFRDGLANFSEKAGFVLDTKELKSHVSEGSQPKLEKIRDGDFSE